MSREIIMRKHRTAMKKNKLIKKKRRKKKSRKLKTNIS